MTEWHISADTGGTFTDILAAGPNGEFRRGKVLSSGRIKTAITKVEDLWIQFDHLPLAGTSWLNGRPAWINGHCAGTVREILAGRLLLDRPSSAQRGDILELDSGLEAPVLAMRMLLPEIQDTQVELSLRLGTTRGTNALLENKGARVALFLSAGFADLMLIRDQKRPDLFAREIRRDRPLYHEVYAVDGRISTSGEELEPLDEKHLSVTGRQALAAGCDVAAVSFLNSWKSPSHECRAMEILRQAGFKTVVASSSVRPLIKYLDRTDTVLVNATLSPVMDEYLDSVEAGIHGNPLWIMTSSGGLVSRKRFHPVDSLVSGPAGGVLGAVAAGLTAGMDRIIGLDMGGTSTDVARWKDKLELRQRVRVGQANILTPAMPIETVAAGGGSICGFRDGRLFVGPESAGADPGPASYGAGGPLCLTDIHLLLGRINPKAFSIPIRLQDARERMDEIMSLAGETDWRALAEGFLAIATERMAHAIRQVTLHDGEDPAEYGLVAFGGAGGLQACRVADELGIHKILFPSDAGILSAKGIHFAPREVVMEKQLFMDILHAQQQLPGKFGSLSEQAAADLRRDGVLPEKLQPPVFTVFLRIVGQEAGLPVNWNPGESLEELFRSKFVSIFGYYPEGTSIEAIKIRVKVVETTRRVNPEIFDGDVIAGPRIISDPFATFFVESGWHAIRGNCGSYEIRRVEQPVKATRGMLENVRRTLVMNRLESLVEEMGEQLQRTAISTNIRERLDFSCGLLDSDGRLVVNAPHIPVHLGALGLCVRETLKRINPGPGDVIVTNHPAYGGSHLPDVTLLCGLFDSDGDRVGFLANRAHHAEWGGSSPGSMPADASTLLQEGVVIEPMFLLQGGTDHFEAIRRMLETAPYPSRLVAENLIDLKAQLASLEKGRQLFRQLLHGYSGSAVAKYFRSFYQAAADASLSAIRELVLDAGGVAEEKLDDGHIIRLQVKKTSTGLLIDFTGTSGTHPGNLNATPAIVQSAVLYVLRLLTKKPMPLNEGLVDKVHIRLPACFLNPDFPLDLSKCPAVVGGNVETSQRIVDALIRAFGIMAAGQGSMNNFLFGNERFGYYETIGGGSGAGPGFEGASGVHVHMTNTAITDPEVLEQRFPVRCREFSLRKQSGGCGQHRGGDGLVREVLFLEPVTASLLCQNRTRGPRGLQGGMDGCPGKQWKILVDGTRIALPGTVCVELSAGEGIRIETPGGGGWGSPVSLTG